MSVDTQNQVNSEGTKGPEEPLNLDDSPPPLIVDGEVQPILVEEIEKGKHETLGI